MSTTDPNIQSASCPGCGAHYDFPASMSGRRGRCATCGTMFSVPAAPVQAQAKQPPSKPRPAPVPASTPQYVPVECRVCQTLMYGRLDQVGKKLKCPDCGALSVVPPPPPPKRPNIPAALEGEQYELWDADEQPLPSELVAHQPKYIAVTCRKCATLMYAAEKQVGQSIVCPDCGTKHVVPTPPKPKPKVSVLTRDAETPDLDWAADPGERPSAISPEVQQRIDEEAKCPASEYGDKLDVRGRAIPPRWPLVTGIFSFPFYSGCRVRWAILTFGLLLSAGLLVDGIPAWATWRGDAMGALEAMGGLAETLIGAVLFIVWLAAASNIFIAIVSESSEGHGHISTWPPMNFIDSMAEMLPMIVAITLTAGPGWALGRLLANEPWQLALMTGATLWLGFPITLLSQLAGGPTWELIDLRILAGMARSPFSMLLFYFETLLLAAVCVASTYAAFQVHALLPFALAPLYVYCGMVYARLLGRLGLRLASVMPALEDPGPES